MKAAATEQGVGERKPRFSVLAIVALVAGLLCVPLLPLVLGIIARLRIGRSGASCGPG